MATVNVKIPMTVFPILGSGINWPMPIDADPEIVANTIDGRVICVLNDAYRFSARSCSHEKHNDLSPSSDITFSNWEFHDTTPESSSIVLWVLNNGMGL